MLTILTLTLMTAAATEAQALSGSALPPDPTPQAFVAQSNGMSLNQAVEQVRRQYGGRILSAETRREGNREVHHIKVLTEDGKVKTVKVPGSSR